MNAVIYQYWDGQETPGNIAGVKAMSEYAKRIGVKHIYEHNPRFRTDLGKYSPHYGSFKPVFTDLYHYYDYVLFADTDVVPTEYLTENIFEQFEDTEYDLGICEEWNAPETRVHHNIAGITSDNDKRWAKIVEDTWQVVMPKTDQDLIRVFNSGVVLYTNKGLKKAREHMVPFEEYVKLISSNGLPAFYTCDQPYLHAMLEVCDFNWKLMDYKWNSSVHFTPGTKGNPRPVTDLRKDPNFVHIQLNGADNWSEDKIHKIVNQPVNTWW